MTERNWKENTGTMPVGAGEEVIVKFRNGEWRHGTAGRFGWSVFDSDASITHWDYEPHLHDRVTILDTAKEYITKDRAVTHGQDAEDSFGVIADFWSAYLGMDIDAEDVCAMMALLKLARIKNNPTHLDSWIDAAGYSALGGEIATAKPSRG